MYTRVAWLEDARYAMYRYYHKKGRYIVSADVIQDLISNGLLRPPPSYAADRKRGQALTTLFSGVAYYKKVSKTPVKSRFPASRGRRIHLWKYVPEHDFRSDTGTARANSIFTGDDYDEWVD